MHLMYNHFEVHQGHFFHMKSWKEKAEEYFKCMMRLVDRQFYYRCPINALSDETCQHTYHYQNAHSPSVFGLCLDSSLVRAGSLMVSLIVGSYRSSQKGQCPTSI